MAKRIATKTPPKEKKRNDGDGRFTIVAVDREQNVVSLDVGGYPVKLICSPENNSKPYQQVKAILVDAVAGIAT